MGDFFDASLMASNNQSLLDTNRGATIQGDAPSIFQFIQNTNVHVTAPVGPRVQTSGNYMQRTDLFPPPSAPQTLGDLSAYSSAASPGGANIRNIQIKPDGDSLRMNSMISNEQTNDRSRMEGNVETDLGYPSTDKAMASTMNDISTLTALPSALGNQGEISIEEQ